MSPRTLTTLAAIYYLISPETLTTFTLIRARPSCKAPSARFTLFNCVFCKARASPPTGVTGRSFLGCWSRIKPSIQKSDGVAIGDSSQLRGNTNHPRGSGRGVEKSNTSYLGPSGITSTSLSASVGAVDSSSPASIDLSGSALPFRPDASALGSYTPPRAAGSSKRRFSEMDRAAERGLNVLPLALCLAVPDATPHFSYGDPYSYEVITAEKAIDENNVGNRMLRNMGWLEIEEGWERAWLRLFKPSLLRKEQGRVAELVRRKLDPILKVQAGGSRRKLLLGLEKYHREVLD
ncbi:hypothetical protein POM88_036241 [Heracleum sosnowskyi]|uniref:Uncharacterized protein n=1 Tax=Heracleum sosnowskyi TaxID=360622 RepID=A0AAD8HMZ3_9APIA|nr:hypothetical protein POM88_036241 [Heracleum sosnowskyi]